MPAYVLVEISIHNPELYESYKKLTLATIEAFGGRFVVRGAQTESLEGDWNPERFVMLKFPSVETAKNGGLLTNIPKPKTSATRRQHPKCWLWRGLNSLRFKV